MFVIEPAGEYHWVIGESKALCSRLDLVLTAIYSKVRV